MLTPPKVWTPVPLDLLQLLASQCSQPSVSSALIPRNSVSDCRSCLIPVTDKQYSVIEAARTKIMEMEPSIDGEHGHDKLWAVVMTLMDGYGLFRPDAAILLKEYNARLDCDPETDKALEHKLDDAEKEIDKRGGPSFSCLRIPDHRVPILVDTELHIIRDSILGVLPLDESLYTRGEFLVWVSQIEEDKTRTYTSNARGTYVIGPIGEAAFTCKLVEHAYFYIERVSPKGERIEIPCNPPSIPIRAVLEAKYHKGVRSLTGIVEAPYLDLRGDIVSPGYNGTNGTIYIETVTIPALPETPSQADARSAAERLLELVQEFPFASQDDKVTWLSGVITSVARPMICGPAPGLAIIGNKSAVGKGKLVHIASIIATGRPCPATSYPTDKEEARKVKTTLALNGTSMVLLDDLDEGASYGNGPMDSCITENIINERILGGNRLTGPIELRPTWFLTGNNVVPGRDAHRRWLVCNVVSDLVSPEERVVTERNILEKTQQNRSALLRDVLIILKAHHNAGSPDGGWAPLGSFEEWDRIVRAAVWYATGLDCNTTRKILASESPELLRKLSLLSALQDLQSKFIDGTHPFRDGFTVNIILELAGETRGAPAFKPKYPDLVAALRQHGKNDSLPSAQSLGMILSKLNNVVLPRMDGWRLQKVGVVNHSQKWCVVCGNPPTCPGSVTTSGSTGATGADSSGSGVSSNSASGYSIA